MNPITSAIMSKLHRDSGSTESLAILETYRNYSAEFPPFHSYEQLGAMFGNPFTDPVRFEEKWIIREQHQIRDDLTIEIACNIIIVERLHKVWEFLTAHNALGLIKSYDGCFNIRPIRGSVNTSLHSYGLAIDINASSNELGTTGTQPEIIKDAFKANGFFWGGDFRHRKDPMHFEFTDGNI